MIRKLLPIIFRLAWLLGWLLGLPFRVIWSLVRSFRFWVILLLLIFVVLLAYHALSDRFTPMTSDAYVQAFVVQVAPQVDGQVVRVAVSEGDQVKTGDLLFELDARPFEHRVAMLTARVSLAKQEVKALEANRAATAAELEQARADEELAALIFRQEQQLIDTESTTQRRFQEAQQTLQARQAAVRAAAARVSQADQTLEAKIGDQFSIIAEAQAKLAEAELQREYTRVFAPQDGLITNLQLREGAYVHTGQAALTLIENRQWQIVANFRENQLVELRPGMPALVSLRGEPGRLLPARVVSQGWGVGQGQGVPSGLLPDVKRSATWLPPAQRFQVRLELDQPQSVPLRVGMTGVVSVYTDPASDFSEITRTWHWLLALLDYL